MRIKEAWVICFLGLAACWPGPRVGDALDGSDPDPLPSNETDAGTQPPDAGSGGNGNVVTLTEIQTKVFGPSCGTSYCHNPRTVAPMSLAPGESWAELVNKPASQAPSVMRVIPGNAAGSYLILKLKGKSGTVSSNTNRMPLNKPALDPARIAEIEAWINRGAPND